jgi:CheY-like chemotaxis protein/anti-sigma regulatory factor (Ser/Thr protein kinase)
MEAQLVQAQKLEIIGSLAGGIAHDFNNILLPIMGFAEILDEDLPPESSLRECVEEIVTGTRRARELIQQIMTFSRRSEREVIPIQPQPIVKAAIKLIRATIPSTIDVTTTIANDCKTIMADATEYHQLAMNLITNAYHALAEQRGRLSIALANTTVAPGDPARPTLAPGSYVCLTVADNGMGIPQAHLAKIFDPYFTTKPKEKGTGLGLSIVHGIVKRCNGEIFVQSEVGRGTTFEVFLPAVQALPAVVQLPPSPVAAPRGSERLLVVDDEAPIIRLQRNMLERLGYRVDAWTDAPAALEAFMADPDHYDLVITDMAMPKMAGDQLARKILTFRPSMPIIICTGFSERISPETAQAIGVRGFLLKPVVKSEMAGMIRRVLDAQDSRS